jgi:peptidyl-tRNA hydrolase, PTH1 family
VQLIFGIGNPGSRYQFNRHNAGFLLLDHFARSLGVEFKASKGDYFKAEGLLDDFSFLLIKPSNYVNNSGIAARQIIDHYSLTLDQMLVVCDDVNLDLGRLRVRKSGGDGGHNGLGSIIYHLNSNDFPRLRIGIRNQQLESDLVEFVLSDFNNEELITLKGVFEKASSLVTEFIKKGISGMLELNSIINQNRTNKNLDNNTNGN